MQRSSLSCFKRLRIQAWRQSRRSLRRPNSERSLESDLSTLRPQQPSNCPPPQQLSHHRIKAIFSRASSPRGGSPRKCSRGAASRVQACRLSNSSLISTATSLSSRRLSCRRPPRWLLRAQSSTSTSNTWRRLLQMRCPPGETVRMSTCRASECTLYNIYLLLSLFKHLHCSYFF